MRSYRMAGPKGHPNYNTTDNVGGRPKRYTQEYVEQLAIDLDKWTEEDEENIFIEEFCYKNRIPEQIVSEELINFNSFSEAYARLKTKQKTNLFKGGLNRKHAHPMCALLLSHNHGIVTKTEQKITGSAVDPLTCLLGEIDGNTKKLVNDDKSKQ